MELLELIEKYQYWLLGGAFVIIILVYLLTRGHMEERKQGLSKAAMRLGFEFLPEAPFPLWKELEGSELFSRGIPTTRMIENVLKKNDGQTEITVFEYEYTAISKIPIGKRSGSNTLRQGVIYFRSPGLDLPAFTLKPETTFQKIKRALGIKEKDSLTLPALAGKYLLRAKEGDAVRKVFENHIASYYKKHNGLATEGAGVKLIFYYPGKRIEPEHILQFIEEGLSVYGLFSNA